MHQQPNIPIDESLIGRYLAGEATPEEAKAVDEWLDAAPENKVRFRQWVVLWEQASPGNPYSMPDEEAAWRQLCNSLAPTMEEKRPFRIGRSWWAAALLVISLGAGIGAWWMIRNAGNRSGAVQFTAGPVIHTDTLTDKSFVTLAPGGKLKLEPNFSHQHRNTTLEGEGYFTVKPDKELPFSIQAGPVKIIVVGTRFNVKEDTTAITVSVNHGLVKMIAGDKELLVKAGSTGIYHIVSHNLQLLDTLHRNRFAYATRELYFHSTPLEEVKLALEAVYRVKIVFENTRLARCRLNTQFNQQSLQQVVEVIAASLGIQYRMEGDIVYFSGHECK